MAYSDPLRPSAGTDWLFVLALASVAAVALAFTPLTVSLDDIKASLFLGLGGSLLAGAAWLGPPGGRPSAEDRWLMAFGLAAMASGAFADQKWLARRELALLGAAAGFFLAFAWAGRGPKRIFAASWALAGLMALEFSLALFHYAGGLGWARGAFFAEEGLTGSTELMARLLDTFAASGDLLGTFLNEDFFSGFAASMTPLAVALGLAAKRQRERAFCLFVALLGVFCVLIAMSKESLAALGLGLGLVALLAAWIAKPGAASPRRGLKPLLKAAGAAGAMLAVFAGLTLWHVWPRFQREIETVGTALSSRLIIWRGALGIWTAHPVLGAGPGSFRVEFPPRRPPYYFEHEISNVTLFAHNLYLDVLAETGLLGALAFGGFLLAWLLAAARALRNREAPARDRLLMAGFVAAFAAAGVQNLASPWTRWPAGLIVFCAVLGLGSGLARSMRPSPAEAAPEGGSGSLAGGLRWFGIGAAILFAAFGWAEGVRYFRAMSVYRLGYEAHGLGDYPEAIGRYEESLAIWPDNLSALYRLGALYSARVVDEPRRSEEFLEKAADAYEALERRWPCYAETPYNRALLERAQALLALEESLRAEDAGEDPGPFQAEALARMDAAIAQAERFHRLSAKFPAWRQLGDMLAEKARLLEKFGPEGTLPSEMLELWIDAGLAYEGALAAAERAQSLGRGETPSGEEVDLARRNLLDALKAAGLYARALALAEEIYLESPQSDSAAGETVLLRLALDDLAGALETAKRNAADSPLSPVRWSDLATVADMLGEPETAARARARLDTLLKLLESEGP